MSETFLLSVLFPAPVLTATTAMTGLFALIIVSAGPRRWKAAPFDSAMEALRIR
ncbi:MAG: hypothetical protein OK454_11335 [Thaumarchaeota archaeon]|nr:hypothetical protein [Nitrososphaerota archaeon]